MSAIVSNLSTVMWKSSVKRVHGIVAATSGRFSASYSKSFNAYGEPTSAAAAPLAEFKVSPLLSSS